MQNKRHRCALSIQMLKWLVMANSLVAEARMHTRVELICTCRRGILTMELRSNQQSNARKLEQLSIFSGYPYPSCLQAGMQARLDFAVWRRLPPLGPAMMAHPTVLGSEDMAPNSALLQVLPSRRIEVERRPRSKHGRTRRTRKIWLPKWIKERRLKGKDSNWEKRLCRIPNVCSPEGSVVSRELPLGTQEGLESASLKFYACYQVPI